MDWYPACHIERVRLNYEKVCVGKNPSIETLETFRGCARVSPVVL